LAIAGLVMVSCDYDKDASNHKLDANQINYIVDAKTFSEMETKRLTEEGIIGDPLDFTINTKI